MDEVDQALKQLFYALLKASPKSEAITLRQLDGAWEVMGRRRRIVAIMTSLLHQLED